MSRGINDSDIVLGRLKLPEGDINRDSTLTLGLEFVQDPGVLEGALAHFGGFLFEFLNGSLVNTAAVFLYLCVLMFCCNSTEYFPSALTGLETGHTTCKSSDQSW